jgi:ferric-dicitrate binding protein FerR (iron transport regulator)
MDRIKKTIIALGCLVSGLSFALELPSPSLGELTQVHGMVTYVPYRGPLKLIEVKEKDKLLSSGSYLTRDDAFMTIKLFDGSFLRMSPKTKFSIEIDYPQKIATIHLFTGSMKVLISQRLNQSKIEKFLIKSGDGLIEASEAKFSVIRNLMDRTISIFTEKGLVTARLASNDSFQLVHNMESILIEEKSHSISSPEKISKKHLKYIHGAFYLKDLKPKN